MAQIETEPHSTSDVSKALSALSELTAMLLADDPIETLLNRIGELAAKDLTWVESCGITTAMDGHVKTVAATSDLARSMDKVQDEAQAGPCLDALNNGIVVTISDCTSNTDYPGFARQAVAAGVLCVLALPLIVGEDTVGVLNLYGNAIHQFDDEEMRVGQLFAAQAALVIIAVARHGDQVKIAGHLEAALNSRAAIDQAIGVLMAAHNCSPARAFDHLREASQHRNVKLRLIAAETLAATQVSTQAAGQNR